MSKISHGRLVKGLFSTWVCCYSKFDSYGPRFFIHTSTKIYYFFPANIGQLCINIGQHIPTIGQHFLISTQCFRSSTNIFGQHLCLSANIRPSLNNICSSRPIIGHCYLYTRKIINKDTPV